MKKNLLFLLAALMLSWSASAQMILKFNTTLSGGTSITLPLNGTVDVVVEWGDGTRDRYPTAGDKTHTYPTEGNYTVEITGTLDRFGSSVSNFDFSKLTEVTSFGNLGLKSLNGAFSGAVNLEHVPDILPTTVTELGSAFNGATKFNQYIGNWNVSNITSMSAMFEKATSFNQDISSWDVSNVTDMLGMFSGATSFNQDLSSWDVSKVCDMGSMFAGVKLSTENYSKILIGWSARIVQTDIEFDGGKSKYYLGAAADARAKLTGTYQWIITDGGISNFTHIPDNNFLQALKDLGHGTGAVGNEIPTANLSGITSLDVKLKTITDLTGIEAFIALEVLDCSRNHIVKLDVSKSTALQMLICNRLDLTYLDLTKNTALEYLKCDWNKFITLDVRNGNNANLTITANNNPTLTCIYVDDKAATYLPDWTKDATATYVNNESECTYTYIPDENFRDRLTSLGIGVTFVGNYASTPTISGITSLDVHNRAIYDLTGIEDFAALKTLLCYTNPLTSLDLSKNTALEVLNCTQNLLTSLDVSKNTALTTFNCDDNKLTSLDISKNMALTSFKCNDNKLKSLDVSKNKALTTFACNDNELSTLNMRNGKNASITAFKSTNNPNLTCIYVDDKTASYLSAWTKGATAHFVNNESECGYTYIPDSKFLQAITEKFPSVEVSGSYVKTDGINTKTIVQIPSYGITDLTGIQGFVKLELLNCNDNLLKSLDVSKNISLKSLNCSSNSIATLNLSANTALTSLTCNNNQLASLNLSANIALTSLTCNDNKLTALDIRNGKNSIITIFNAIKNPQLTCIYVDDKNANLSAWMKDATAHFVNNEAECGAITTVNDIKKQSVSCYPNPTNGILNFDFAGEQVQNMKIVNIAGETVFQKANLNQNETIDMSAFANGLYLVTIQTDKENLSFKIIKQ